MTVEQSYVDFPAWPITLALVPVTLFLITRHVFRAAHRMRAGRCTSCNYDLYANVSGRCPECGEDINRMRLARLPFALMAGFTFCFAFVLLDRGARLAFAASAPDLSVYHPLAYLLLPTLAALAAYAIYFQTTLYRSLADVLSAQPYLYRMHPPMAGTPRHPRNSRWVVHEMIATLTFVCFALIFDAIYVSQVGFADRDRSQSWLYPTTILLPSFASSLLMLDAIMGRNRKNGQPGNLHSPSRPA